MSFMQLYHKWAHGRSSPSTDVSSSHSVTSNDTDNSDLRHTLPQHPQQDNSASTSSHCLHDQTLTDCNDNVISITRPDGVCIRAYKHYEQAPAEKPIGFTRFVCMSDTHSTVDASFSVPPGDVFLHAGDLTQTGARSQVESTVAWLSSLSHPQKLVIAGNHDVTFHAEFYKSQGCRFHQPPEDHEAAKRLLTEAGAGLRYLENSEYRLSATGGDWHVYGSPWQPEFCNWAFNGQRGAHMREIWSQIPDHTDILITHGPPYRVLDRLVSGERCGCADLLARVQRVRPIVHVFGHIHESHGLTTDGQTVFINASTLDHHYCPKYVPIIFDLGRVAIPATHENAE